MIELKDIRKSYTVADSKQTALDGVSLTFRDNEFVAVLGPSGSGKTTLLNILGGLDHADSGDIVINGVSTGKYKDADWDTYRNHRIGFIFQSYNLIPHQSVRSNVELALTLSGVSREERRQRATDALERVGLGEHVDKRPNQLSGGQMQRVAIARALINDPDIVLADEPTGALDTETGLQVMDLLEGIAEDRLVIMVTHNPDLAQRYATRIVSLTDGRITADSNPITAVERASASRAARAAAAASVPAAASARNAAASEAADAGATVPLDAPGPGAADPGETVPLEAARAAAETARDAAKGSKRHASMSFGTAVALSFNNLMTKKARTFLTAFAGSIGIIGIAAILALSNGVNNYIEETEEDALSSYPITVTQSAFDITNLMLINYSDEEVDDSIGEIQQVSIMSDMFAEVKNNDLSAFKEFLESGESDILEYTSAIEYTYDIEPLIFSTDTEDDIVQLSPSTLTSLLSNGVNTSSFVTSSLSIDSFQQILSDEELVEEQMEVVAGRWPESYDEAVLVLSSDGVITDYTLYALGVYDTEVMNDMMSDVIAGNDVTVPEVDEEFTYDDALDLTFSVVGQYAVYEKNEDQGTWTDMSDDDEYMAECIAEGVQLKIVGVVQPNEDTDSALLSEGVAYTAELTDYLIEQAAASQIVQEQMADPDVDVFTGETFEDLEDEEGSSFDLEDMFSIDTDALSAAFSIDTSSLTDLSIDTSSLDLSSVSVLSSDSLSIDTSSVSSVLSSENIQVILSNAPEFSMDASGISLTESQQDEVNEAVSELAAGFMSWMLTNGYAFDSSADYGELYNQYLEESDEAAEIMSDLEDVLGSAVEEAVEEAMQSYMTEQFIPYLSAAMSELLTTAAEMMATQMALEMTNQIAAMTDSLESTLASAISGQLTASLSSLSSSLADGMSIDADAFADAIEVNMTEEDLTSLLTNYMNSDELSYDNNLASLGYADKAKPTSISIYATNFEAKDTIKEIIDQYNEDMIDAGHEDGTIDYSDIAGMLMTSVNKIVNMISWVLIAFVSISLVVSSIMIGIITYISVLERKKEIGILRAMGASKGNIANVFIAETVIEGLIAGVFAIAVVMLASFPVNAIVEQMLDVSNIMILPWTSALILIGISVLLTFIAGLIPSSKAARRDPVEALRSE